MGWKDHGWTNDAGNWPFFDQLPGGHEHSVENTETGEFREVQVHDGQDVGEAIANAQWTDGEGDEDEDDDE